MKATIRIVWRRHRLWPRSHGAAWMPALAQQSPPTRLLDQVTTAMGGRERLQAIGTLVYTGFGQDAYMDGGGNITAELNVPPKWRAIADAQRSIDLNAASRRAAAATRTDVSLRGAIRSELESHRRRCRRAPSFSTIRCRRCSPRSTRGAAGFRSVSRTACRCCSSPPPDGTPLPWASIR